MNEPEFVDELPLSVHGTGFRGKWLRVLAPLMDHETQWAVIDRASGSSAAGSAAMNLRQRRVNIPPGKWEFASRTVDGEHRVYARYMGPE